MLLAVRKLATTSDSYERERLILASGESGSLISNEVLTSYPSADSDVRR